MKYPSHSSINTKVPSITGGLVSGQAVITSQPSSWPRAPKEFDSSFLKTLREVFQETVLDELRNVIRDIQVANAGSQYPLSQRGHVIAVAYMCALDSVSAYGYTNRRRVAKFIRNHFPAAYRPHAARIYPEYRLSLVHAWNLFGSVALLPGNEPIIDDNGQLQFGLLNFAAAFEESVDDFLNKLATDEHLQENALRRYRVLTGEVRPSKPIRKEIIYGAVGVGIGVVLGIVATLGLSGR